MAEELWICPVCQSLAGEAVESCEGYIDIPDHERGETVFLDASHAPISREDALLYHKERGSDPHV